MEIEITSATIRTKDITKEPPRDSLPPDKLKRLRESLKQNSLLEDSKLSRIADALMESDPDFSYIVLNASTLK